MLSLKEEFSLKSFKLSYSPVQDFVTSPWFPTPILIAYRTIFGIYSLTWLIYIIVEAAITGVEVRGFFYITRWSYVALIIYFLLSFNITIIHYVRRRQGQEHSLIRNHEDEERTQVKDDETRWFHQALWLFYSIAANMAITVTIYFWVIDYKGTGVTLSDVNVHILNAVFIVIDHTLSSMPWRLLHFIFPVIFSLLYFLTTVMYWLWISTEPIYTALDYSKNPGLAVGLTMGATFILEPLVQIFLYLVFRLRCFLEKKWMED